MKNNIKCMLILVGLLFISSAAMAQVKKGISKQVKAENAQPQTQAKNVKEKLIREFKLKAVTRVDIPRLIEVPGHGFVLDRPGNNSPKTFYDSMTKEEKDKYSNVIKKWKKENESGMYSTLAAAKSAVRGEYRIPRKLDVERLLELPIMEGTRNGEKGFWFGPSSDILALVINNKSDEAKNYCLFLPFAGSEYYGQNYMKGINAYYLIDEPSPNNSVIVCLWIAKESGMLRADLYYALCGDNYKYPVHLISK